MDLSRRVIVPFLVGLGWREARDAGFAGGFHVSGPDPDGPPLASLGWPGGVIVAQQPDAGTRVRRGDVVTVWIDKRRPGDAGDREPSMPPQPSRSNTQRISPRNTP